MATTYLTRTPSSGAATQKVTFSFWVKKTNATGTPNLFRMYTNATQYVRIRFESSNKMSFIIINSDSYVVQLISTKVFRDPSAWYHIVCNMDTTQATASDRAKIYVNGERITAYDTAVYPPTQNANIIVTPSGTANHIGTQLGNSPSYFEGCMSHVHFTDGYVYQASEFGSVDSTSGIWKINTSPSVTYGTNGFFILKDGNTITDSSPNSNNFSLGGGTLTKTEDCPSNVFATFNPLDQPNISQLSVYTYGNTVAEGTDAGYVSGVSTIAPSTGKYYAEFKMDTGHQDAYLGIIETPVSLLGNTRNVDNGSSPYVNNIYSITQGGDKYLAGAGTGNFAGTFTSGDILGVALDCDNNRLYFSKGGQWTNGSGAYNSATPSGYITLPAGKTWHFIGGDDYGSGYARWSANFGNGYFKGVAISSEGTNASGNGKFEYNVPSGYTALSTKGLNL